MSVTAARGEMVARSCVFHSLFLSDPQVCSRTHPVGPLEEDTLRPCRTSFLPSVPHYSAAVSVDRAGRPRSSCG